MVTRYVLVDCMHLAYATRGMQAFHYTKNVMGVPRDLETTIPNYITKRLVAFSGDGLFNIGVCMEGGSPFRKAYFAGHTTDKESKRPVGYKEGRTKLPSDMAEGLGYAEDIITRGAVSLYKVPGYEADDCIGTLVHYLKAEGKPITVITNDYDLLPLVDDQVSVYMRNPRKYAEVGELELTSYFQVTPRSWDEFFGYSSTYKQYHLPYNSILLYKMIKGDPSDNIAAALKGYGPVKYSNLMRDMLNDGVDFKSIFRYGVDFDEVMRPVLCKYFNDEELKAMQFIYEGINLRMVPVDLAKGIAPGRLIGGVINKAASEYGIMLKNF